MALLKNPYLILFAALYLLAMGTLTYTGVYSLAEPLFMLVIFGLLLPGTACLLCRRCRPVEIPAEPNARALVMTLALVAFVTVYLVWGSAWVDTLLYRWTEKTERTLFFLDIIKKVLVFVVIPYLALARTCGLRWRNFGFVRPIRQAFAGPYLLLAAVFFLLYFLVQLLAGQAAQPLFRGEFSTTSIIIGGILLYLTQIVEVGLVEEFFFRAVLQTRLAVWLKSELAGVLMMALIFGLAHAPGLYLRGAGAVTSLGAAPDLASAVAYSVAVISLAGLAFGVIWAKTRNIYILILIHAWVDTLAGLPGFIEIFGL